MKKLLILTFLFSVFLFTVVQPAFSQSTVPRFGIAKGQDNTGRVTNYALISKAYAATDVIKANASETIVKIAPITGAVTYTANVTNCNLGDKMVLLLTSDASVRVVTLSTGFSTSKGTLTTVASTKYTLLFVFDGVAWVETGR
jgi:hypothetical protein